MLSGTPAAAKPAVRMRQAPQARPGERDRRIEPSREQDDGFYFFAPGAGAGAMRCLALAAAGLCG